MPDATLRSAEHIRAPEGRSEFTGPYCYLYGGLLVKSDVLLEGLEFTDDSLTVDPKATVRFGIRCDRVAAPRSHKFSWPGRYGLTLWEKSTGWVFATPRGTEFHVNEKGSLVDCFPAPDGWTLADAEVFVRRVLPRIVQQHGSTVVQAAAVDCGSGAVLLCGESHSGKSTLATSLQRHLGWNILSDDMAVLVRDEGGVLAFPTETGSCLWKDSLLALGADADGNWQKLSAYEAKYRGREAIASTRTPLPVRAIYFLESPNKRLDEFGVVRESVVSPRQALATISSLLVRFDPSDHRSDARHFELMARLAASAPVRLIEFPRRFDVLPEVTVQIREDLHAINRTAKYRVCSA